MGRKKERLSLMQTFQPNQIICGDAIEVLKTFPDMCIDVILTDPPWGIGLEDYDNFLSWERYANWFEVVCLELKRVLKPERPLLVETSKKYLNKVMYLLDRYFTFRHPLIYLYSYKRRYSHAPCGSNKYGIVLWYGKGESKVVRKYFDVLNVEVGFEAKESFKSLITYMKEEEIHHTSPKGVAIYQRLIEMFSEKNDIILDPFVGSGTTAIASKILKRRYIGIEINPQICKLAEKRIEETPTLKRLKDVLG